MKIFIKNMVCNRCILVVSDIFRKAGIPVQHISLGEVNLSEDSLTEEQAAEISRELLAVGFEQIDDKKARLIEKIKNFVIQKIHHSDSLDLKINWSVLLANELHYEYNYLSGLFSSVEGITLEQYIIHQKIEKAKELLFYDELNTSEIADRLGYSSVQHLSSQFRKVTGLTPSQFKKSRTSEFSRKSIDHVRPD